MPTITITADAENDEIALSPADSLVRTVAFDESSHSFVPRESSETSIGVMHYEVRTIGSVDRREPTPVLVSFSTGQSAFHFPTVYVVDSRCSACASRQ